MKFDRKSIVTYLQGVAAKSAAGISTPSPHGAQVASPAMRLFLCAITPVLVGRMGSACARRSRVAVVLTRSTHLLSEISTSLEAVNISLHTEAPHA